MILEWLRRRRMIELVVPAPNVRNDAPGTVRDLPRVPCNHRWRSLPDGKQGCYYCDVPFKG